MTTTLGAIMTREPKTLRPDQTLLDAMCFLRDHGVRHIPIVDGDGRLLGVVTDRDVKRATPSALIAGQRQVWDEVVRGTPVAKIMTREVVTGAPATPLREAVRRFVEDKIGCLPVVEGERVVGIVTAHDLLRVMLDRL
ncbi:MAG: CBS domain-containing protein [Planctomycetes bacterium]|nr:CBS domain-containing protein [Planctomycetota bacterium]